jgi:enoyl-CoA hydratase
MPSPTIDVEWRSDRVVARLDRPERRNAINADMVAELHALLDRLVAEPQTLIVTGGDQGTFAAGADIGELLERDRLDALAGINVTVFERLRRLPMPVIAAVDGPAIGGGAELAYAADIRIASDRAVFANPETQLGILAGAGACYRLPALVGEGLAKEMLLAGRRLDATEALAAGLVSRVVAPGDLLAAAHAVADEVGKGSRLAVRLTKAAVDSPPSAHPGFEILAQAVLFEDPEKVTRMQAFLDRRSTR